MCILSPQDLPSMSQPPICVRASDCEKNCNFQGEAENWLGNGTASGQTHSSFTQSSELPVTWTIPDRQRERPCYGGLCPVMGYSLPVPRALVAGLKEIKLKWDWIAGMCYLGHYKLPSSVHWSKRRHIIKRPSSPLKMLKIIPNPAYIMTLHVFSSSCYPFHTQ